MCVQSKQEPAYLVYQATFLIQKMCVQNKRRLLFNLLSYFCNMKNACLKQAGGCFLVYFSLISIVCLICSTTKNVECLASVQILENCYEKIYFCFFSKL